MTESSQKHAGHEYDRTKATLADAVSPVEYQLTAQRCKKLRQVRDAAKKIVVVDQVKMLAYGSGALLKLEGPKRTDYQHAICDGFDEVNSEMGLKNNLVIATKSNALGKAIWGQKKGFKTQVQLGQGMTWVTVMELFPNSIAKRWFKETIEESLKPRPQNDTAEKAHKPVSSSTLAL